jgi:tetratricopeptide (TPR) repeat protein
MKNSLLRIMTVSLILMASLISLSCKPSPALAYNDRVVTLIKDEKYEESLVELNKAIEIEPQFAKAYYNRGLTYYYLADEEKWNSEEWKNQINKAILDFNKVIELKPDAFEPYFQRGYIYYESVDYDAAIQDFSRAIALNPKDEWSFLWRGYAHTYNEETTLAIADFEQFVKLAGDDYWFGEKPTDFVVKGVQDSIDAMKKELNVP